MIFSSFSLKLIISLAMTCDHVGMIFFPQSLWFRLIGRLVFPLLCFMLVVGAKSTKNKAKYLIRVVILAFISQPFYALSHFAIHNNSIENFDFSLLYSSFNAVFSLSFSLLSLYLALFIYDKAKYKLRSFALLLSLAPSAVLLIISVIFDFDYAFLAIPLTLSFSLVIKKDRTVDYKDIKIAFIVLSFVFSFFMRVIFNNLNALVEIYMLLFYMSSLIFIFMFNGKNKINSKALQYAFYLYYPAHLFILSCIKFLL